MNREIKFRGISIDEWVYGMLCKVNEGDTEHGEPIKYKIQTDEKEYGEYVKCFITDEKTIGQYTGLHDKNGKEIYEGDIIEWTTLSGKKYRFSVEYSNKYAQYIITNTGDVENEAEPLGDYENIEVIGNVFENGDILNDSKNTEKN